jgi:uncharacterized protein
VNKKTRIVGFDLARALAVFGMVLVNFKVVMNTKGTGSAWLEWLMGLLDGRAAATFVLLAGVGLSLLSAKGRENNDQIRTRQDRNTLLKRAIFLLLVGLAYIPIWPADILHFYGVYIAVAAFLLTASDKRLLTIAAALPLTFLLLISLFNYETGWNWATLEYVDFWTAQGMLRHVFFNGFHPVIPWLAFMLLGMWLGRQDLHNANFRTKLLAISFFTAAIAESFSALLTKSFPEEIGVLFDASPMPPMPIYIVAGAATALVIILLCLEITFRYPDAKWISPLVHTGQLALTLYVAHVVLGMGVLEILGRLENQNLSFAATTGIIFSLLSILFSHLWRKRYQRGPLEWVMRKLT